MKALFYLAVSLLIIFVSACSKNETSPSSLSGTTWKYSGTNKSEVLKFTSATSGTYTVNTNGTIQSSSFSYSYASPSVEIKESGGSVLEGNFSSTSTLQVTAENSPLAAVTFTKQ